MFALYFRVSECILSFIFRNSAHFFVKVTVHFFQHGIKAKANFQLLVAPFEMQLTHWRHFPTLKPG